MMRTSSQRGSSLNCPNKKWHIICLGGARSAKSGGQVTGDMCHCAKGHITYDGATIRKFQEIPRPPMCF